MEALTQVFSFAVFKSTYIEEHLQATTSEDQLDKFQLIKCCSLYYVKHFDV